MATQNGAWDCAARSATQRASSMVVAMGFSQRMATPASNSGSSTLRCV